MPTRSITEKVRLFTQAFNDAWTKLDNDFVTIPDQRSRAATVLRDVIERRIKGGETDAAAIADGATEEVRSNFGIGRASIK
ncbi:MAG: hypothetical protein JO245_00090 [Pseudolabrys sp.]|nr:hypothetical protein [Pseudolabrys sp.]